MQFFSSSIISCDLSGLVLREREEQLSKRGAVIIKVMRQNLFNDFASFFSDFYNMLCSGNLFRFVACLSMAYGLELCQH